MTITNSRLKPIFYGLASLISIFIISQCMIPMTNPISRWIASNSVYSMLIYFGLGGIALLYKRPYLMLGCWLITIGLCHFLKDATSNPFYYSPSLQQQTKVRIAHFNLETTQDQEEIFLQLPKLDLDFISIQSFSNALFEQQLMETLASCYPYQHQLQYHDISAQSSFIFSKVPLEDLDSFHCEGVPYINGFIQLDSNSKRRIQFVSLHIPKENASNPEDILHRLDALADKCALHKSKTDAFLAFGAIPMASWSPEIRAFRTRFTLNDSQLDVDWDGSHEHIFYSDHLRCTSFQNIKNGVIGHYQYSPQHIVAHPVLSGSNQALTSR